MITEISPDCNQEDLEILFSKYQLLPELRAQFLEITEDHPQEDFLCDMLTQIYLHRQADPVTMVGILSPKYGTPQEVADKLLIACEEDFIEFNTDTDRFSVLYEISADIEELLAKFQYPLPMIEKPQKVRSNFDTGYKTITGSLVLNGSNYFNNRDICLDHINRANSVGLSIDEKLLHSKEAQFIKPHRKNGESFTEYKKRLRQADIFYNTSLGVMRNLDILSPVLYVTYKYDRRGRIYASGYHVNPQGTDYNKAVLGLAKKEYINEL